MRIRTLLSNLTAFAFAAFIVDAALAVDKTWIGPNGAGNVAGGNWNTPAYWDTGSVPTSADRAVFPAGGGGVAYTVTIDIQPAVAQRLDVHAQCTLSIGANKRLELGSADGQTSDIDGQILLTSSSSALRFMFDHTVRPKSASGSPGVIVGQDPSAKIDDDPSNASTLTLAMNSSALPVISGCLTIDCSFVNNGLVDANGACVFTLLSGAMTGNGEYRISGANATLNFAPGVTATSLNTYFNIQAGTLDVDTNVQTSPSGGGNTGQMRFVGGSILVDAGMYFKASL